MRKLTLIIATLTLVLPVTANAAEKLTNEIIGDVFVSVNGLVCDFCARALEKVFSKQESVNGIQVNLDTKIITIDFKDGQSLDEETIKTLVTDAGYNLVEVNYGK